MVLGRWIASAPYAEEQARTADASGNSRMFAAPGLELCNRRSRERRLLIGKSLQRRGDADGLLRLVDAGHLLLRIDASIDRLDE